MTDWNAFLLAQGAAIDGDAVRHFGEAPADYPRLGTIATLCDLADLGVLAVTGAKSAAFLQGQTTADFVKAPPTGAIRGACCNPQGRVFALFTAIPDTTGYLLILPHALIETTRDTLSRYAALSRVALANVSAAFRILGLASPSAAALLAGLEIPVEGTAADGTHSLHHDPHRSLLLVPTAAAETRWQQIKALAQPVGLPFWRLADIRAGIAVLSPATREQFLPQMLDLDRRGAVSFNKGCYTGQEVVARSQHLGKLKRHLYRLGFAATAAPASGTSVSLADGGQPVGMVIAAAMADTGRCEALAVLRDETRDCATLDLGAGPQPVTFLPLPSAAA